MNIEFGFFLRVRREDPAPYPYPEDVVSAASTTASQVERADDDAPIDTAVRIGFGS